MTGAQGWHARRLPAESNAHVAKSGVLRTLAALDGPATLYQTSGIFLAYTEKEAPTVRFPGRTLRDKIRSDALALSGDVLLTCTPNLNPNRKLPALYHLLRT